MRQTATAAKAAQESMDAVNGSRQVINQAAEGLRSIGRRMTAPRIYRAELCLVRRLAAFDERHPRITSALLWAQAIAGAWLVFMYA